MFTNIICESRFFNNQIEEHHLAAVQETISTPKRDSKARAFLIKIVKKFRFTGTPLKTAEDILGARMHRLQDVSPHLGHPPDFLAHFRHLEMVPFMEHELVWAARSGRVGLTLYSVGPRRLVRANPDTITIPSEEDFLHSCNEKDLRTPRRPQWWLWLTPAPRGLEIKVQRDQPETLRKRMVTASLGVAVSAMYLDYKIHGLVPDGLRLTSGTRVNFDGVEERLFVGENLSSATKSPLRIVTGHNGTDIHQRAIVWTPRHVYHPEVY